MRCRSVLAGTLLFATTTTAAAQMPPPRVHNRTLSTVAAAGRQVFRLDGRDGDGVVWWPDAAFTTGATRSGNALTFGADAPGETNHLAFEVTVTGNTLTGSLSQTRDGRTRTGRLAFTKQ